MPGNRWLQWRLQEVHSRRESSWDVLLAWRDRSRAVRDVILSDAGLRRRAERLADAGAPLHLRTLMSDAASVLMAVANILQSVGRRLRETHGFRGGWSLGNCLPVAGRWKGEGSGKRLSEVVAAGVPCSYALCPWCWMRRYAAVRRLLLSPAGKKVKDYKGRPVEALGLPLPWRVSLYESAGDATDPSLRNRFDEAVKDLWRNRPQEELDGWIRRRRVPEFFAGTALRSLAADSDPFSPVRFRTAVVHGCPTAPPDDFCLAGPRLTVARGVFDDPDDALRFAWPYPAEVLDRPSEDWKALLEGPLYRRRSYERVEVLPESSIRW